MYVFSEQEPSDQGPRWASRKEIEDPVAEEWVVECIEVKRFEVRTDLKDFTFREGGPKAWFVVVRRSGEPQDFASADVHSHRSKWR